MEIKSGNNWPSSSLSNFSPHIFYVDGILCNSMEGFLQSLKFKNPLMQEQICTLVGKAAKMSGSRKNWKVHQILWWKGNPIPRDSQAYQDLLDKAFISISKNTKFANALLATGNSKLKHSIGKKKKKDTVLTKSEFISRLHQIRNDLKL